MNELTTIEENQIERDIDKVLNTIPLGKLETIYEKIELEGFFYYLENYDMLLELDETCKRYLNEEKFYLSYFFFNKLIKRLDTYFS